MHDRKENLSSNNYRKHVTWTNVKAYKFGKLYIISCSVSLALSCSTKLVFEKTAPKCMRLCKLLVKSLWDDFDVVSRCSLHGIIEWPHVALLRFSFVGAFLGYLFLEMLYSSGGFTNFLGDRNFIVRCVMMASMDIMYMLTSVSFCFIKSFFIPRRINRFIASSNV